MAIFLKKFETQAAYEAAESSLILPNVSLTVDNNTVHYNPSTPPTPSHDYVEIGGIKWATMNVGASSVTDYGNYYMYGKGADDYSVTSGQSIYSGTENPLASSADTVAQVWGGQWHMPTKTQFEELTANTTYEWTTINGVNGGKFTAANGNHVFFPAAGWWSGGSQRYVGNYGLYLSSTPFAIDTACYLYFDNEGHGVYDDQFFGDGCTVRGVVG